MWPLISTVLLKLKEFSRSQAVMDTVKVVISEKWCKLGTLLQILIESDTLYLAYRVLAVPMTLSDLQGHALNAGFFECDISYRCAAVDRTSVDIVCHRAVPL